MATPDNIDPPNALPRGTRLGEFEIRRVLGAGGFGIVYLAFDHALEREVAIKEYMPASLAGRTATLQVSVLSAAHADTFALGLRSFVNEARLLARFDHPSLVKVHRYWEDNQTAYMAMPFYRGRNLHRVRRDGQQPPTEAWLRGLLDPLLGAIERLHAEAVYHRDIAPDNIILQPDGRPVLLDFGAARRVISDQSLALTAILKPAYAPIEQYAEAGSVRQGPWTDLYALGATLHHQLLGAAPPPATARTVHDDATPLATLGLPGCSPGFLHAIDWMLRPRPADRPQSVAELRAVLDGEAPVPEPASASWARTQVIAAPSGATQRQPRADAPPQALVSTAALAPTQLMTRPGSTAGTAAGPDHTRLPTSTAQEAAAASDGTALSAAPTPTMASSAASRPMAAVSATPATTSVAAPAGVTEARRSGRQRALPLLLGALALVAGAAWWLGMRATERGTAAVDTATHQPTGSGATTSERPDAPAPPVLPTATPTLAAAAALEASAVPPPASGGSGGNSSSADSQPRPSAASKTAVSAPTARPAGTASAARVVADRGTQTVTTGKSAMAGAMPTLPPNAITSQTMQAAEPMRPITQAVAAPASPITPATSAAVGRPAAAPAAADPMVQARPLSPSERCEGRVLVALYTCIENQCNRMPELRDHPECQKLRRDQDQRSGGGARN